LVDPAGTQASGRSLPNLDRLAADPAFPGTYVKRPSSMSKGWLSASCIKRQIGRSSRRVNGSGQAADEVVSEQGDRLSVDLADPRLG
jgi:hypothetical protein